MRPLFGVVITPYRESAIVRWFGYTGGPALVLQEGLRYTREDEILDVLATTTHDWK